MSAPEHDERANRYALDIPALPVAILGIKNVPELHKAVATMRACRQLDDRERREVTDAGQVFAKAWGEHRGPVA